MAKWLMVVETNCKDGSREAEYNDWYDNTHLPDVLEVPGFTKATRYENVRPAEGKGKFLASYEIETEDLDQTMAVLREHLDKKRQQGRMTDLLERVSVGHYRQISSR